MKKKCIWHTEPLPCLIKTWKIMRLSVFFLFVIVAQSWALDSYSQVTRLSLDMKGARVIDVLGEIENKTEFFFLFNQKLLDVERRVDIEGRQRKIDDILNELFSGTNVNYLVINRQIVLTTAQPGSEDFLQQTSVLQQRQVMGKVADRTGAPLPGVTVVIKGTTTGTITDGSGNYILGNIPLNATLVFSFVGMLTQQIVVGDQTILNVTLETDFIGIEEVVAVGFGTQKKVNLTGAVATVPMEGLNSRPVSNTIQAFQGLVPGLNIKQSGTKGGELDNNPSINIRGVTTIGAGSKGDALILIDGVEGNLNTINVEDIDNVSILKDASSSAIYGSRAAFGVILVTTKKGRAGKFQINFNSDFRWNSPILLPEMANSYDYTTAINDAAFNAGQTAFFPKERIQRIQDYMSGKITTVGIEDPANPGYWQEMYFQGNSNYDIYELVYKKFAPAQQYSLNFSGGNENITYYLSGNYLHQDGLLKLGSDEKNDYGPEAGKDWIKKYNLNSNINIQLAKWASLMYIGKFSRQDYARPTELGENFIMKLAKQQWPMLPLYDDNGYYSNSGPAVPLVDGGRSNTQADNISNQIKLTIEPIKDWKIFGDFSYIVWDEFYHSDHQYQYNHDVAGNPYMVGRNSYVEEKASRNNFLVTSLYSEYSKSYKDHNLKIMAGFQSELTKFRYFTAQRSGIIVRELPSINVTTGADFNGIAVPPTVSGSYSEWATEGYFGRVNYNYKGRYLVEASLRYDGTSRFGADKRWNYFPSASVGWNVANEDFWKTILPDINSFKIRGSFGLLGNQNTSSWYPTYINMPIGTANGTWLVNGIKTNTASAPGLISSSLSWESIKTYDVGADLGLFKNRLTTTFDWYIRYTNDMMGPAPELPVILGTGVPKTNNTDLSTTGFELSIGWKDRLKNGLGYGINFSLADSRARILNYPNPTNSLNTYVEGQLMGQIWGYTTIGIAKSDEEMNTHLATLTDGGQNALGSNWKAGDIMYQDINNDGKITSGAKTLNDHGDLSVIGNNLERFPFSIDLWADWKGFDIRAFIQGIGKRDYATFPDNFYFWGQSASSVWSSTVFKEHLDYFRGDADNPLGLNLDSYYPRPIFKNFKNMQTQTKYLQNAAYGRLKNMQVGYTLPSKITQKYAIQKFRIYASGDNLFTVTKMKTMFDPETVDGGWGGNIYPLSKVYSVGVNITF